MEDELDQLIENAVNFDDDPNANEDAEESPEESNAMDESAETDALVDDNEDTGEGDSDSPDGELPDSDQDGTEPDPDQDPSQAIDPGEYAKLQRLVEDQQNLIRTAIINAQKQQGDAARQAKEAADEKAYQDLLERMEDMDPDDARREHTRFLTDRFNERQQALVQENQRLQQEIEASRQAQAQSQYEANEAAAKAQVIDFISDKFKLTEFEKGALDLLPGPQAMEEFAKRAQASRQNQTKAAREAKRSAIAENPALRVGDGTGSAPEAKVVPKDLDELVDNIFR